MNKYAEIFPAFEKNNVVLTLTSSDLYAPYVGVLLESVIENSSSHNNYDIFIFESDISEKNKHILNSIINNHKNFSLRFIDVSDEMDKISFSTVNPNHSKYNFYRLLMLSILVNFDKAIYFDSDLIIKYDIAELFLTNVNNFYLAAAKDIRYAYRYNIKTHWTKDYCDNVLKLKVPYEYFSSGVMVMNLAELRKDFTSKQLIELSASSTWKTVEQDVLNMLMQNRVKFLSFEWNYTIETKDKGEKKAPEDMYTDYLNAQNSPKIIHYVGNNLPCINPNVERAEDFWIYAKQTGFFETLICRMNNKMLKKSLIDECNEKIKIFVSHRIDFDSETLANPLLLHMRCGAIYDSSNSEIVGDNILDNISDKRNSFCELTVQYWAWKNFKANYYGLFQYRRYLSFRKNELPQERFFVREKVRMAISAGRYGLMHPKKMEEVIQQNDVIIPKYTPIQLIPVELPGEPPLIVNTVYDFWTNKTNQIDKDCLDFAINLVKERQPEYYPYLIKYLHDNKFRGANCYIMRKELFNEMCKFQFDILFELEKRFDMSGFSGDIVRMPGFIGEILYAAFIRYLEEQGKYKIKTLQLVFFADSKKAPPKTLETVKVTPVLAKPSVVKAIPAKKLTLKGRVKHLLKKAAYSTLPAYRISLANKKQLNETTKLLAANKKLLLESKKRQVSYNKQLQEIKRKQGLAKAAVKKQKDWDGQTVTANDNLKIACTALEIRDTHRESFLEFKRCNTGRDVAIIATGPTMGYYEPIDNAVHIGVNRAFKNDKIKLDYYFITDFEHGDKWMEEIKNYDCIKFFGQYPAGMYRDRFQASEQMIVENNARRYFQGAPSEDIHINIEYYPLMAYYSVTFQALHFALYTNPKRIFLVGCDCSFAGHFDGEDQHFANPLKWLQGYQKLSYFAQRFYPGTEIISINPVGLKSLFKDMYTESYLEAHPEIDKTQCDILDLGSNRV